MVNPLERIGLCSLEPVNGDLIGEYRANSVLDAQPGR